MKRLALAAVLLFLAVPSFAGLTYRFESVTTGLQKVTLAGSVAVDGGKMRLDISSGDGKLFRNGTYALMSQAAAVISVVDPATKSFYELRLDQLLGGPDSAIRQLGMNLSFDNPKVTVTDAGDGGAIEGYPTKRRIIEGSYDLVVDLMDKKLTMHVELKTESWITDRLGSEYVSFLQLRGIRTGVESFDKLVDAQAGALTGFPLKQVSTVRVTQQSMQMTSTTTTKVSGIAMKQVPAAHFALPAGFTRTENPIDKMLSQMQ